MTDRPATALTGTADVPPAGLEPDAIGPAQDTIIGMANAAPAVSVGLTLAALAAAAAYAVGPIIVLTAIPMLIIANAYRRLNLWKAQCGASFEWVGRAINPYLGFLTRVADDHRDAGRGGFRRRGPSPIRAGGVRLHVHQHVAGHPDQHRHHPDHDGDRDRGHQDHGPDPGRHGADRVRDPDRLRDRRPGAGAQPPSRHVPDHQGMVHGQRDRRQGQPRGRVPHCGVHVHRLGRECVRQRGDPGPERQPGPGRCPCRPVPGHHLHDLRDGPAGRGVAGQAPGELVVGPGLRGAGDGRRGMGQGDGARPGAVRDRLHRRRDRGAGPDDLRDGAAPGAAARCWLPSSPGSPPRRWLP